MGQVYNELYEVVSNVQRRQLLFALLEESPKTDSPEELDTPPNVTKFEKLNRIECHHVHLPKLDDYGFINWFPEMSHIERGPKFDEIEPTLELLAEHHKELPEGK
ncbi:hypothetical protein [Natrinema soli]|uniref:Transcriptional regulator n=1 Tax=Natrinema soli TaxID=1930624 RepID=A0ABD5STW9_9EURY|nr:hypothetical protein [Natrinema soli]